MGYGVTPVVQPSGVDLATVTLGNTDGEIGGLTISDPPMQAEVQALRDACEKLADDMRAFRRSRLGIDTWSASLESIYAFPTGHIAP